MKGPSGMKWQNLHNITTLHLRAKNGTVFIPCH